MPNTQQPITKINTKWWADSGKSSTVLEFEKHQQNLNTLLFFHFTHSVHYFLHLGHGQSVFKHINFIFFFQHTALKSLILFLFLTGRILSYSSTTHKTNLQEELFFSVDEPDEHKQTRLKPQNTLFSLFFSLLVFLSRSVSQPKTVTSVGGSKGVWPGPDRQTDSSVSGSGEGGGAWDLQLSQKAVRVNSTRWSVAPVWWVTAATVQIKHFLQRP